MSYLLGWAPGYFMLFSQAITRYRGRALGFFILFVFASIAVIRGATGTDTANYEMILDGLSLETIWDGVEPGFGLIGLFFTAILGSSQASVRAVAVLFYGVVGFYYYRSNRNEAFVLFSYWAPAFFYAYSMNGLRIGIASALLLLNSALHALYRRLETFTARCISMSSDTNQLLSSVASSNRASVLLNRSRNTFIKLAAVILPLKHSN